jgi:hypothetical protein
LGLLVPGSPAEAEGFRHVAPELLRRRDTDSEGRQSRRREQAWGSWLPSRVGATEAGRRDPGGRTSGYLPGHKGHSALVPELLRRWVPRDPRDSDRSPRD